jgi:hypothetical protein
MKPMPQADLARRRTRNDGRHVRLMMGWDRLATSAAGEMARKVGA